MVGNENKGLLTAAAGGKGWESCGIQNPSAREKFATPQVLTMVVKKNPEGAWDKEWKQEGRGVSELPLGTLRLLDGLCFPVEIALGSLFPEGWPGSAALGQACWEPPWPSPCSALGSRTAPGALCCLPEHSSAAVENYKGHSPKKPRHLFWFSKHFINVIDNTSSSSD